ncbi:MAG: signal peptide peptidase SppA [Thermoleophilia bacterium]|nr:signal peptide peptidase SppA [Thermoleophilia bacterium]
MSRGWKVVLIVGGTLAVLYAVFLGVLLYVGGDGGGRGGWGSSGTVGVLRLDGVVSAGSQDSLFGSEGIDPVWAAETLRDADADSGIDAVVLRVNSPGGSPAASWEIYQAVKAMGKPVVVSVADVAASGAYYFSSPADLIVAAPSSQVGSIGVILSAQDLSGLYEKLGIGYTVLTKGKYKDIGSPAREMTQEEKDILSAQMDTIYRQFITDVADGRKNLEREQVEALATGLTYPGEEALRLGLVDKLGSYGDATNEAARLAGLDVEDYRVRDLAPTASGGLLSLLLGAGVRDALRGAGRDIAAGLREEFGGASAARPRVE